MTTVHEVPASTPVLQPQTGLPQLRTHAGASHYRRQALLTGGLLLAADLLVMGAALTLSEAFLRGTSLLGAASLQIALATTAAVLLTLAMLNLYAAVGAHPVVEMRGTALAACVGGAVYLFQITPIHSTGFALSALALWLALVAGLPAGRSVARSLGSRQDWWGIKTLVIGDGDYPAAAYGDLRRHTRRGLRPIGWLYRGEFLQVFATEAHLLTAEQPSGDEYRIVPPENTPGIVVVLEDQSSEESQALVRDLQQAFVQTTVLCPQWAALPSLAAAAHEIDQTPGLYLKNSLLIPGAIQLKRAVDLVLGLLVAVVAAPVALVVFALIKATSRGPALYSQERIGRRGRRFRAWKFRTMVINADEVLAEYLAEHPELQDEWQRDHKLKQDPRVTRLGRFLRKSSLDELPQLLNILRGEMSLVGPRPIVAAEIEKYGADFPAYMRVVPGVTGMWQISGRNDTTYEQRVRLDAYYVRNWSIWLDLYILVRTIKIVISREGAY